jgi:hypothetical protein
MRLGRHVNRMEDFSNAHIIVGRHETERNTEDLIVDVIWILQRIL